MSMHARILTRPTLPEVIRRAKHWVIKSDDTFCACYDYQDWGYAWPVSHDELSAVNPQLPSVIHGLAVEQHWATKEAAAPADKVRMSLSVLLGEARTFYDFIAGPHVLIDMMGIRPYILHQHSVWIAGTRLHLIDDSTKGPCLPLVEKQETKEYLFEKRFLRRDFPGWEERYELGKLLELKGSELAYFCFPNQQLSFETAILLPTTILL